jgi:hypothetical protein
MISLRPGVLWRGRLAILLALLSCNALQADDTGVRDTVATRARPEVDPLGAHVGGFAMYPKVSFSYLHDDNVLINSGSGGKEGSFVSQTSPEVAVRSNWSEHALNLLANATLARFADFPNENYNDWLISADGRLDPTPDIQFAGGGSVRKGHILRTSPENTSSLDEPITYDDKIVFVRYAHAFGHFRLGLDAANHQQDYHSALGLVGGVQTLINEDDRDRTQRTTNLRLGYETFPGQQYFLQLKRDRRVYEKSDRVIDVKRSSEGESALLGMTFDLNGLVFGEWSAGYLRQDYQDPFPDINKPLFGASLNWNVTRLSTVKFIVQREIGETTSSRFSGYTSTSTLLGVEHELRRHVLVDISLNYTSDDFQGIGAAEREDKTYDFYIGPTYLINRYFRLSAAYHRLKRDSSGNTSAPGVVDDYLKNIVLIQFQAQL